MKILHYALGFPPFRRGGMTKYCIDLMSEQLKCGHEVGMLWPGRIKKYGYKLKINKLKCEKINNELECDSYEMINPLPVPLLNGINNFNAFTQEKDESVFYEFLKDNKIEVIHIHTLMGLPKECISAAKRLNIRLIYTTHDYFGLCPKWGFIYNGKVCGDDDDCKKCIECNKTSLSLSKIKILQSNIYRNLKDSKIIMKLRKRHNENLYEEKNDKNKEKLVINEEVINISKEYRSLRKFYIEMLKKMDVIHFNSWNTQKIFNEHFSTKESGKIISITHSSIKNNKKKRNYKNNINLGYLGPITEHKGFYILKKVCDKLYDKYKGEFKLHIFQNYEGKEEYIVKHSPYKYNELDIVMDSIDILIVPSLWNETFGFTTLEALSYGVPVIVSKYVGSKDILENNKSGLIYEDIEELQYLLENIIINKETMLYKMNEYIVNNVKIKEISEHTKEINELYKLNIN